MMQFKRIYTPSKQMHPPLIGSTLTQRQVPHSCVYAPHNIWMNTYHHNQAAVRDPLNGGEWQEVRSHSSHSEFSQQQT